MLQQSTPEEDAHFGTEPERARHRDLPAARGRLIQQLFGLYPAQVLHTLVTLAIPDQLAGGACPVADLAKATDTHEPSLRRLLRSAIGLGLVQSVAGSGVALTEVGQLLRADVPGSIRNLVLLWGGDAGWRSWGQLAYSIQTGRTAFEHLVGRTLFEHLADHPEQRAVFNQALAESTRAAAAGIVEVYRLDGRQRLVDVGGGNGTLLAALLRANQHLAGVLLDRPSTITEAHAVLGGAGVLDRCEVVGGNFFDGVPTGADAYLLKSVLHDWADEQCRSILRNCRAAMADDAVLHVIEPIVPTDDAALMRETMMLTSDLNMLVCTGGIERTEDEFKALLADTGFRLTTVTRCPAPSNLSVLRAVPA
jgi:hypothetical protein